MIARHMNLIKDLNCEMKDMKTREEIFEIENEKFKAKLQKTRKELKESKDDLEKMHIQNYNSLIYLFIQQPWVEIFYWL